MNIIKEKSKFSFYATRDEAKILVRVLDEFANGFGITEGEFHILTGLYREEVRELLRQLHAVLVLCDGEIEQMLNANQSG